LNRELKLASVSNDGEKGAGWIWQFQGLLTAIKIAS
jgi:hypothetical protein